MVCKQQTFISHSSGGWGSEIRAPALPGFGGSPLAGWQGAIFFLCLCILEGGEFWSLQSLIKALIIPFMRMPPSGYSHLPKVLPPNILTSGVRISTYEFWGDTNIQSIAISHCLDAFYGLSERQVVAEKFGALFPILLRPLLISIIASVDSSSQAQASRTFFESSQFLPQSLLQNCTSVLDASSGLAWKRGGVNTLKGSSQPMGGRNLRKKVPASYLLDRQF